MPTHSWNANYHGRLESPEVAHEVADAAAVVANACAGSVDGRWTCGGHDVGRVRNANGSTKDYLVMFSFFLCLCVCVCESGVDEKTKKENIQEECVENPSLENVGKRKIAVISFFFDRSKLGNAENRTKSKCCCPKKKSRSKRHQEHVE